MNEKRKARVVTLMNTVNECITEVHESIEKGEDVKASLEILVVHAGDLGKMAGMALGKVLESVEGVSEDEMLEALMEDVRAGIEMGRR